VEPDNCLPSGIPPIPPFSPDHIWSLLDNLTEGCAVLEQLPTIHWAVDRDLRFTLCTGAGLRRLGLASGEVVGLTLLEFFQTDDPNFLPIRRHREALQGETIRYTQEYRDLFFEVVLEPLRDPGEEVAGVIGLALDVTGRRRDEEERRRLQEQLYRSQKLESLGILAGGVAHDFNNLINAIQGAALLLSADLPADSPLHALVKVIKTAADRAGDVTRQMLVYAGRARPERRLLDLNQLIRDNLPLVKSATSPTITVQLDLAPDLPPVLADPGQLQQVVMNLILNAAEAIADRGRSTPSGIIAVSTRTQTLSGGDDLPAGEYVCLEVRDNGCGMTTETQARIFDPFFTTKQNGRGLGLSAVRGILRTHQGTIHLHSTPEEGTTFRILLPVHRSAKTE
jgi:two-component system cell cycle sensor histidine kinase/response regulator CckA